MKVKELLEKLKGVDPESEVLINKFHAGESMYDTGYYGCSKLREVCPNYCGSSELPTDIQKNKTPYVMLEE